MRISKKQLAALDCVLDVRVYRALSEEIRLELFKHVLLHGPADVGTIAGAFPVDRSVISRHLQQMEECELLTSEKQGRNRLYQVHLACFVEIFEQGAAIFRELQGVQAARSG